MSPPGAARKTLCFPHDLCRPGGPGGAHKTRSHPELGRQKPPRRWYSASRHGRVGRRQARKDHAPNPATPGAATRTPPLLTTQTLASADQPEPCALAAERDTRSRRPQGGATTKIASPGRASTRIASPRQGGATTKIASPGRAERQPRSHRPAGRSDNQGDAGWSSPVARQAHNLKAAGSNPAPATNLTTTTPAPYRSHPKLNPSAPNLARGPDTSPLVGKILVPEAALALGRLRRNRRCNVLHVVAVAVVEAADPVGGSNDASHAAARSKAISAAPESAKASFRSRRSRAGAACWPERMASSSRAEQSRQVHSCSSATSLRVVHPLESDRCGRSASGQAKGVPSTSAGHHGTAVPERAALASCRKT